MMEVDSAALSMRRLYFLTAGFAVAGIVWQLAVAGPRSAIAFFLGALGSLVNLWAFNWLTQVLARAATTPSDLQTDRKSPWGAGLFIGRYAGLYLVGYATVNALDVSPLPVLLGLLASTAAVLASSIVELIRSFFGK